MTILYLKDISILHQAKLLTSLITLGSKAHSTSLGSTACKEMALPCPFIT